MRTALRVIIPMALIIGATWAQAGTTTTNLPPRQLRLEIDLADGSHLIGTPHLKSVPLQTAYAKIDIALNQILTISMGADQKTASLALRNGDDLKGVVDLEPIELDTLFGNVSVSIAHIRQVRVVMLDGTSSGAIRRGLLLRYCGDKDLGDRIDDSSGNKRDGTAVGAQWTPDGRVGGGYRVGRTPGYIEVPDEDTWSFGTNEFSICLWLKLDDVPRGEAGIVGHNEGGGERNKWVFQFNQGNVCFHINSPRRQGRRIAAYAWVPEVDTWHHLSVTRKKDIFTIYVDGEPLSTAQVTVPLPAANAPLTIGQAEGLPVDGTVDEVMIFDRALPGEEIQRIYTQ